MKKLFTLLSVLFIIGISESQNTLQEGFESWPPQDWEFYVLGQAFDGWRDDFNGNANTGSGSAYSSISNEQADNWMVSPAINVVNNSYQLKFWEIHSNTEFYDKATVLISTGSSNPNDGEFVEVFESNSLNDISWEERTIDLIGYTGQTIHVAFRHEGTFHAWNIDDVSVSPPNFTDAGFVGFSSPIGVSENPAILPVIVQLKNYGQTVINEVSIPWEVNGVAQTTFTDNTLVILPGETESIALGNFNFDAIGSYDITAGLVLTDDFDDSNNDVQTSFDISPIRDGGIVEITPVGLVPINGTIDVKVAVENFGSNPIDIAEITWEVNGVSQNPFTSSSLNILPGETKTITIGTFNFPEGINTITATLDAFGDNNPNNDSFTSSVSNSVFFESFEGPKFPPEGWSMNFGTLDDINFDTPVDGDFYYVSAVDNNFFGEISDTLYTPLLNIENGDIFRFYIKTSQFFSANHTLVYKDGTTGQVNTIATIANSSNSNWALREIDISAAAGINQIGIVSTSTGGYGESKFDLFTSDAELHQFNNDLRIINSDIYFLARQNTSERFECTIRNAGSLPVLGTDYTVKLMEAPGIELASVSGVNLSSWEYGTITIDYTFTELADKRLYFEIDYSQDENTSDNTTYFQTNVSIVPNTVVLNSIGSPNQRGFIPFTPNGNTNTLGEDDLAETLYYNEEFSTPGMAYGMAYKYDNLLPSEKVTTYPLQVWIAQSNLDNLDNGWTPTEELVLVFDGEVEFLPGNNRDLYIPFNQPVMINGIEDVVVRTFQYDPEWPPAIFRFLTADITSGPTRTIGAFDVFQLNPLSPPDFWGPTSDVAFTRFVIDPASSNSILTGTVTDSNTALPIENATISILGSSISAQTDSNGNYTFPSLPYGIYEITVSQIGYAAQTINLELNSANQVQDFVLVPLAEVSIFGTVYGSNDLSTPLSQVDVVLTEDGNVIQTVTTDSNGVFIFPDTFEDTAYEVATTLYGYFTRTVSATPGNSDLNLGDIIMDEEFISPFDVIVDTSGNPDVTWKTPKLSAKEKLQRDTDVISNSYTNEPLEEVWLGNEFEITEITTITSVEIRTDVFNLAEDFVTIDIFDVATENIIASSEPFLILNDSTQTIEIPNIVVTDNIAVMVHWQNNVESTSSLAIDFTLPSEEDSAVIKYPGQPITLVSPFLGGGTFFMAFHVRVNTLTDGTPTTNNESVSYNVYRGLASEFPDITNWDQINTGPVSDLSFEDIDLSMIDTNELYRYAVETVYNEGESELTFSGEVLGQEILSITDVDLLQKNIFLYPNPAEDDLTLELLSNFQVDQPIEIFDTLGKRVLTVSPEEIFNGYLNTNVSSLPSGVYFVKLSINGTAVNKKFIKK
ncbi:choice-of-anchor J domain-containing protein [Winogradskyella sp. DF17]|uniref:Choice-of-anchor J domain-containing protein n=1 Tax=Winogradskyella pelagia TaxID=2819984 RepID=A0ABS3T7L9_9FLAO|nr:choice-of-anchor J domain-containing protein [Winogradskyella sp. DF17]MBO3117745.1 choice-of-anchor J domain-containing protein [Winogradskyella sp. DF17]